jgi:putative IMPACT (imprinted ancient) family translation regulator
MSKQTDWTAKYYEGMRINAHQHYAKMVEQTGNYMSVIHTAIDFYCEYQKLSKFQRIIQAIQFKRKRFNPPSVDETPITNNFNQNLQAYIGGEHE